MITKKFKLREIKTILFLVIVFINQCPSVGAADSEVSLGYDSYYIDRGENVGSNLVWSDINVTSSLSDSFDISVGTWYANLTELEGTDELEFYSSLSTTLGKFSLAFISYYHYYPNDGENSIEFGMDVGTSAGPIDLNFGVYYDIDIETAYYELGVGTSLELSDATLLDLGMTVGNVDGDTLTALTFTSELPITLTDKVTLSPYVGLNIPLEDYEDTYVDNIFTGVSLKVGF